MKKQFCLLLSIVLAVSCMQSQDSSSNNIVGGPCEGCEAVLEYKSKPTLASDTLPEFNQATTKIKIKGIVYAADGVTPAKNIIIYAYHTNEKGIYPTTTSSKGWERRHGYLRTWLKTNNKGEYSFYTCKPASYPNSTVPQHIHMVVKEPNINEYYIDDIMFTDDPNLPKGVANRKKPRGGTGLVTPQNKNGILIATRNIYLGKNIPNYPLK